MKLRMSRMLAGALMVATGLGLAAALVAQDFGGTPVDNKPLAGTMKPIAFPVMGKVDRYSVSIRALDTINSPRLTVVFKGDELRIVGESSGWYKIELPREFVMWVSKEFVKVGADGTGVLTGDNVNVRSGPGTDYRSIGMLDLGRRVEIIEEKDGWLKFKFAKGDTGYIGAAFVTLAGEAAPRAADTTGEEPGKTEKPPVGETRVVGDEAETDQAVIDSFKKAEEIYNREVAKENVIDWELSEAKALYMAVAEKAKNREMAGTARRRLVMIQMADRLQERMKPSAEALEELAAKEKVIEEEFEKKRLAMEKAYEPVPVNYFQKGKVESLAVNTLQPCTHKLIQDGKLTYLLYSETVDIKRYDGVTVGIQGEVDKSMKWPIPVIRVTGVVLSPDAIREAVSEKPLPPSKEEEVKEPVKEVAPDQPNVAPPAKAEEEEEPK